MIHISLEFGLFTDDWKCALVLPLLKKSGLDLLYKNYRPVSDLSATCQRPVSDLSATCSMFQSWLKGWCLSKYTPIWWLIHYILSFSLHIIKIIARKRLLLESRTIFSWKWTLKKSPCWPYSILALLSLRLIITSSLLADSFLMVTRLSLLLLELTSSLTNCRIWILK